MNEDQTVVTGSAAIREVLKGLFVALPEGKINMKAVRVVRAGENLAVLYNDWNMAGKTADGSSFSMQHKEMEIVRRQKSQIVERSHWRASASGTNPVATVLALCTFLVLHGIANAAAADKKGGPIEIKAHYETTPDHLDMVPPCSTLTSLPSKGTCRGLGRNTGPMRITG